MSVYVDNARIRWRGWRMSHLFADSSEELHTLAAKIGLKREWYQDTGHGLPHYDVTDAMRSRAVGAGAVALPGRDQVVYREIRRRHARGEWQ